MKPALDQATPRTRAVPTPSTPTPSATPALPRSRSRWLARLGNVAFWGLVLVLITLNLDRARNLWPPLGPPAITRLIERNQGDAAESALRDRLRRNPFEGDSRLSLAQLVRRRGDMAAAARELRQVPAWWPTKPEALWLEGQTALAAGLAVEAEAAWRACLRDDPLHPTPPRTFSAAANELIGLLNLEGRQVEAIALLETIHQGSAPEDRPPILRMIADLRSRGTRFPTDPAALATLERCAGADPEDVAARLALAGAARSAGRWDDALRWVEAALAIRPDDPSTLAARQAILAARAGPAPPPDPPQASLNQSSAPGRSP